MIAGSRRQQPHLDIVPFAGYRIVIPKIWFADYYLTLLKEGNMQRLVLFLSILFFCTLACGQATIHVPGDQPTIQAGINAANNGDTVLVADGHYHEHINFNGKNITVTSTNGPAVTIIDGDVGTGPVVRIISHEGREAVLHGFTIEHGSFDSSSNQGSGVEVGNAFPTITGNIITANTGAGEGGGIYVNFGGPLIDSNTVSSNTVALFGGTEGAGIEVGGTTSPVAQISNNTITGNFGVGFGGGIGLFAAGPVIVENNIITGNSAQSEGGGIDVVNNGGTIIVQNLITGNSAPSGAGIYILEPSGSDGHKLINNTVAGNNASTDAAVVADGFNANAVIENNIIVSSGTEKGLLCNPNFHDGPPTVHFNDVFSSHGLASAYAGDCTGFSGSNGNISADPLFVSSSNYHLLGSSPAIDAGDNSAPNLPTLDLDGNPRIVNGTIDMGIYEFQQFVFNMSAAQPSTVTMVNGAVSQPITFQLSTTAKGPLAVTLSCPSGLPTNATCSFSPSATVTITSSAPLTVTMYITTLTSTPGGTSSVTINASAAGIPAPKTQTVGLTVNAGSGTTDLSISAAHNPSFARVGGTLTFTFTVSNAGSDATGVNLNTIFAGRVLSVVATPSQGTCAVTGPVNCSLGTITNGSTATVMVTVTPAFVRSVTATGVVSSNASDSNPANNIQSNTSQVRLRPFARN